MRVKRYDYVKLDGAQKNDQGFLSAQVTATRTGIFIYRKADGTEFRELRPAMEVTKKSSLDSLARLPVTNNHPSVPVNSQNAKEYTVGFTGEKIATHNDDREEYINTDVTIFDGDTITEIERGKTEVSCGYDCDMDFTPGVHNGQRYDAIQKNITYNHLAIVGKGRAGPKARLHLDSGDAEMVVDDHDGKPIKTHNGGNVNMQVKIKLDGMEFEVDSAVAAAIKSDLKQRDDSIAAKDGEIDSLKSKVAEGDKTQAKIDSLESDNEKLKKDLEAKMDGDDLKQAVNVRLKLLKVASAKLDADTIEKVEDMDDRAVKVAIIKADSPEFDAEGKSDDYVNARYDHIAEAAANAGDDDLKNTLGTQRTDGKGDNDSKSKADEKRRSDSMAWSKPLAATKQS